jgi:3'(2'), 5'-bisphosphate nucleotidase
MLGRGSCGVCCRVVDDTGPVSLTDAALAADVARDAGKLLLAVREEIGFDDPYDLGDAGDKRANVLILDRLARDRPADAVLSEEAVDDLSRVHADRVWIVDPVDGTREFSWPGREDWAVHVALWQRNGGPDGGITDAAVALPARREVYRTDTVSPPPPRSAGPIRITASASRPPAVLWRLRDRMDIQMVRIGSAGAKAMAVVRGDVDAYIHAGGQWEWDSAAPAGVVQAAGLHASRLDGSPMIYNRRDPYLPDFLMCRAELADVLLDGIWSAYRDR